jgi:hypothetical protein
MERLWPVNKWSAFAIDLAIARAATSEVSFDTMVTARPNCEVADEFGVHLRQKPI